MYAAFLHCGTYRSICHPTEETKYENGSDGKESLINMIELYRTYDGICLHASFASKPMVIFLILDYF